MCPVTSTAGPGAVQVMIVAVGRYFCGNPVLLLNKTVARTEEGFHALDRALRQRAGTATGVRRVE